MKFLHFFRILFLLALPLSFSTHGSASSLQGKVIEVLDGERITVISLNRPLKVKLVAIAAPVKEQPYADVATQHLSQLVSDKYVVVRYTSLDDDGYLLGRVTVNDMDVGEQMVRDGVAWYDKSQGADFSDQDRQAYFVCEQAARKEARGLWQDSAAVAPWEFRRQLAASRNIVSSQQTVHAKSARAGKQALSSDDIFSAMTTAGGADGSDSGWKTLTPRPGKFSVLVPGNAMDYGATIPTPSGQTADVNYCMGRRGKKAYLVIWAKGPNDGVRDEQVADDTANGLVYGFGRGMKQSNPNFEVRRQRSVRLGPYSGWQYNVTSSGIPGTIRVFSRRAGQLREVYVLAALNGTEEDPQVQEFLGSFRIEKY